MAVEVASPVSSATSATSPSEQLDDFVDEWRRAKVFAAGAAAGACARTVGSPLSRVTILQQTAATGNLLAGGGRASSR